jgi:hypothetical protein
LTWSSELNFSPFVSGLSSSAITAPRIVPLEHWLWETQPLINGKKGYGRGHEAAWMVPK